MTRFFLLALLWPAAALAQATVTFTFNNPALQPPHYTLLVHEDGTGRYQSTPGAAPGAGDPAPRPEALDRAITVPEPLRKQLFSLARKNHLFRNGCDSGNTKVAFTGEKTFSYAGPEGAGSCTFNYARNGQLMAAADDLLALVTTLEEGAKLQLLLLHDKLGLNAEVDILADEQAGGRAQALENIAPVLRAIAADPDVLNHTRTRAEALLSR